MYIDKKEVGERILKIRKSYGYSMKEFGEAVGHAPKGSVNSWEKGVNLPNEERLKQIASMGNMSVNELLYGSLACSIRRCSKAGLLMGTMWRSSVF